MKEGVGSFAGFEDKTKNAIEGKKLKRMGRQVHQLGRGGVCLLNYSILKDIFWRITIKDSFFVNLLKETKINAELF